MDEEKVFDIIAIGDATQDNFLFIDEASVLCDKNDEHCKLMLDYGAKIPVSKFEQSLGGNAANTGVGLTRLGLNTALLTVLGNDDRATWIYDALSHEGIDLDLVEFDERRSNFSSIINFKGERTILVYHEPGKDFQGEIPKTKWIYLTSSAGTDSTNMYGRVLNVVGPVRSASHPTSSVAGSLRELDGTPPASATHFYDQEIKICFNPGTNECKKGGEHLRKVFEKTEIVIVNREEAEGLMGGKEGLEGREGKEGELGRYFEDKNKYMDELLEKLQEFGQKMTVITNGQDGAWGFEGNKKYFLPIMVVPIADPTGAGDSFSAAVTAGLFYGKTLEEAMKWGMINSASVVGKVGATPGLLRLEEVIRVLEKEEELKAEEI